jgi:hypothetical protein
VPALPASPPHPEFPSDPPDRDLDPYRRPQRRVDAVSRRIRHPPSAIPLGIFAQYRRGPHADIDLRVHSQALIG